MLFQVVILKKILLTITTYLSRSIVGQAKFNLWSWASNSAEVQSLAQAHNVAERNDTTKVLGLWWHANSNTLLLAFKITTKDHPVIVY